MKTTQNRDKNFSKVIKTSKGAAYLRGLSTIPFASEISSQIEAKSAHYQIMGKNAESTKSYAAIIEARYKNINSVIRKYRFCSILELASGFSPRSLELSKNKKVVYVDTDLPILIKEKKNIFLKIAGKYRPSLFFISLNILDRKRFKHIGSKIKGPVCIVNEGLLGYLTTKQKAIVAENIKQILIEKGGVWITSDIPTKEKITKSIESSDMMSKVIKNITKNTKKKISENQFDNEKELVNFFIRIGFKVKFFDQKIPLSKLSAVKRLNLGKKEIASQLSLRKIMVLSIS